MAVIAFVLSSVVGAIAGLTLIFGAGASIIQGVFAYVGTAATLGAVLIAVKSAKERVVVPTSRQTDVTAQFEDWHEEENWRDAELEPEQKATPAKKKSA